MSWIGRRKDKHAEPDLVVEVQPSPLITRERITPYVDGARVRVESARERVSPYVETAVGTAVGRVTPVVGQARVWAGPKVEEAKHRAAPVVSVAVDKYVPIIESAIDEASTKLTSVLESAGPARDEVQRRSSAAVAALKGELDAPKPKSSHWGRRFLFLSVLTGLGAAAFAFFKRRNDDDAWITTDTPYPTYSTPTASTPTASTPTGPSSDGTAVPAAATVGTMASDELAADDSLGGVDTGLAGDEPLTLAGDDAAGAAPDEVLADDVSADGGSADDGLGFPADTTTPDEPLERITPKDIAEHIHPHRDA